MDCIFLRRLKRGRIHQRRQTGLQYAIITGISLTCPVIIYVIHTLQHPDKCPVAYLFITEYFGMSAKFWLGLQMDYDLDVAEDELGERLEREIRTRIEV